MSVLVCAAVQRTSMVTSGTDTTTSAWHACNMMMWSTLWPSAQQTRSCCCLPVTTPPLKCGAPHACCASHSPRDTHHGLANWSHPCSAKEELIWTANPDLDTGKRIETLQKDTPWAERHVWGQETVDFYMGAYEKNKGTCVFLVALLPDIASVTNKSLKNEKWSLHKETTKENKIFGSPYLWKISSDAHRNADINRICDFKGKEPRIWRKI